LYSKKHIVISIILSVAITLTSCVGIGILFLGTGLFSRNDDVLLRARKIITENYVDQLSDEEINEMNDAAIAAMVASLDDPYSYYLDADTYTKFEDNNKEEYVGIGVNVSYDSETKTLTVTAPTSGGPAEKAGIIPKDVIVGVDDLTVAEDGYDAIINHIKDGKEGETVKIDILREGVPLTVNVVRSVISLDTITFKMLDDDMAYIKISEFQHNSIEDFEKALEEMEEKGAKGLIIDLRSNPGGYADSVIKMTDMLLPEGTIAYLEDNKGEREYFKSDKNCIDIPMVVLVNEGTASAAELMCGSLQAYEVATVVGMKTYGKAVGQAPYPLTEDTAIYLTSARYYNPKGVCIDKKGIVPDVEVDLSDELKARLSTLTLEEDVQLKTGISTLEGKIK